MSSSPLQSSESFGETHASELHADIQSAELPWQSFLLHFPNHITTYIHDYDKTQPVIHKKADPNPFLSKNGYGVFFSVNGFAGNERKIEKLLNLNAFFVDIDFPKDQHPSTANVRQFKSDVIQDIFGDITDPAVIRPNYLVETKNGYHAYWIFHDPVYLSDFKNEDNTPDEAKIRNTLTTYTDTISAIIERFQGDTGAKDATRVLRVPGFLHRKNPSAPFLCKIVHEDTKDLYSFEQLTKYFLSGGNIAKNFAHLVEENPRFEEAMNGAESKEVIDFLDKHFPILERDSTKSICRKSGIPEGERNNSLFIAASLYRKAGYVEPDTLAVFSDGYNNLSAYEIRAVIKSVYKRPTCPDFGWNNPLFSKHVSEAEKIKIRSAWSAYQDSHKRTDEGKPAPEKENEAVAEDMIEKRAAAGDELAIEIKESIRKKKEKKEKDDFAEIANRMFNTYERIILERYPNLYYVPNVGFYEYEGGVYLMRTDEEIEARIVQELDKDKMHAFKKCSKVRDKILCVRSTPSVRVPPDKMNSSKRFLVIKNGVIDLKDFKVYDHSPDIYSTNKLDVTFNGFGGAENSLPDCPRFRKFLDEVMDGDENLIRLLAQIAGYTLMKDCRFEKAFIFQGDGNNGKSVFLSVLRSVLGDANVSNLGMDVLNSQFGSLGIMGKMANFVEEVKENYFESDIFKKITSGNPIGTDRKNRSSIDFTPFAKLLFAVNPFPKIRDSSFALYRRLIIVPWHVKIPKEQVDIKLAQKLAQEKDGIFEWMLRGLRDLLQNGEFSETPKTRRMLDMFQQQNSPLVEFLRSRYIQVARSPNEPFQASAMKIDEMYDHYVEYCHVSGYMRKSRVQFSNEIESYAAMNTRDVEIIGKEFDRSILGLRQKYRMTQAVTPF